MYIKFPIYYDNKTYFKKDRRGILIFLQNFTNQFFSILLLLKGLKQTFFRKIVFLMIYTNNKSAWRNSNPVVNNDILNLSTSLFVDKLKKFICFQPKVGNSEFSVAIRGKFKWVGVHPDGVD
jgi:hypothetical protein